MKSVVAATNPPPQDDDPTRAILYLRVSTKEQAEMGGEAEGFSIPAQREACIRKAESLGAAVIEEFPERGESAKTADRPELQRLLRFVRENQVDYVIVHKLDRLARNRVDDVEINLVLKQAGVQLVSVTENIDETPSGVLLHGIMSSIAEFYSRNLATEVLKGSTQKAKNGGTIGKAPVGYLNVRKMIDGREVRTVDIDPERAPLVVWAFETYAAGIHTLRQLTNELAERGLTLRATAKQPERVMTANRVHEMLSRRYYLGYVSYRGIEYEGKHERLISPDLFERVQRRLLANRHAGDRSYRRQHYLKGTVFCGHCQSRLLYFVSTGNGGRYEYFHCSGQHNGRTACGLPHLPAHQVEAEVLSAYRYEHATSDELDGLRNELEDWIEGYAGRADSDQERLTTRIRQLKRERYKWAEKAMNNAIPDDIAQEKQKELGQQLLWAEAELAKLAIQEADLRRLVDAAIKLAGSLQASYQASPQDVRRRWNQAWWERIEFDIAGGEPTIVKLHRTPVAGAVRADVMKVRQSQRWAQDALEGARNDETDAVQTGVGSNIFRLVPGSGRRSNKSTGSTFELPVDLSGQLSNPQPALEALAELAIGTRNGSSPEKAHSPGRIPRASPRSSRPLKPAQIDALVAAYEAGKTMKELAVEFDINRVTVSAHLRRSEVPLRRGGLGPERATEVVDLYEAGWSSGRIAERFDVSADTVLKVLREAGVTIRPRRGGPNRGPGGPEPSSSSE